MAQPSLLTDLVWERGHRFHPDAVALADRHYSRRKVGSPQFVAPGRCIVLLTPCRRAVWVTHWPQAHLAMDGLDAWRCAMFRNEGAGLSSDLILAAMDETARIWTDRPQDGWLTFVDRTKVPSENPGYCFKQAGWELDRTWTHKRMVRLRAPADAKGHDA